MVPGKIPATLRVALTCTIIAAFPIGLLSMTGTEEHSGHTRNSSHAGSNMERSLANITSLAISSSSSFCFGFVFFLKFFFIFGRPFLAQVECEEK